MKSILRRALHHSAQGRDIYLFLPYAVTLVGRLYRHGKGYLFLTRDHSTHAYFTASDVTHCGKMFCHSIGLRGCENEHLYKLPR